MEIGRQNEGQREDPPTDCESLRLAVLVVREQIHQVVEFRNLHLLELVELKHFNFTSFYRIGSYTLRELQHELL